MSPFDTLASFFQRVLDVFYYVRKSLLTVVAYVSLRLYASEVSFKSLWSGTFSFGRHTNRHLDSAQELDVLLGEAREVFKRAEARRAVVIDKCKILLTLSSILLAAIG